MSLANPADSLSRLYENSIIASDIVFALSFQFEGLSLSQRLYLSEFKIGLPERIKAESMFDPHFKDNSNTSGEAVGISYGAGLNTSFLNTPDWFFFLSFLLFPLFSNRDHYVTSFQSGFWSLLLVQNCIKLIYLQAVLLA